MSVKDNMIRAKELRVGQWAETELGWREIKRITTGEGGGVVVSQAGSKETVTLHPQKKVKVAFRSAERMLTDLRKAAERIDLPAVLDLIDEAEESGLHETS